MIPFQKILVAIDAIREQHEVIELAARLAEKQGAALLLVDVVPQLNWAQRLVIPGADHVQELILRERTQKLRKIALGLRRRGLDVKSKVLVGRTAEEIIRQVLRGKHDLVVRIAKGPLSRRPQFFGGTSFELLRNCPCSVWLCAPEAHHPARRILATVDPSPEKQAFRELDSRILQAARSVAHLAGGELDVLNVWSVYGEGLVKEYMKTHEFTELETTIETEARQSLNQLVAACPVEPPVERVHLVRGEAATEIVRFVHEYPVELLVMGTVGRSGLAGLLMGNTAEVVLHQVRCSVLALKPQGFVSRVRLRARPVDVPIHVPDVPPMPPIP